MIWYKAMQLEKEMLQGLSRSGKIEAELREEWNAPMLPYALLKYKTLTHQRQLAKEEQVPVFEGELQDQEQQNRIVDS
ncbi:hypothetical protein GOP47_0029460 [Adiantum capillus-veneris]|nr:hypothetical protein GOP47_0029460 [Adiantum capillus-veneris]